MSPEIRKVLKAYFERFLYSGKMDYSEKFQMYSGLKWILKAYFEIALYSGKMDYLEKF